MPAHAVASEFSTAMALRIGDSRRVLAERWLEELKQVVPASENEIFPGNELLGHVPAFIEEIASVLRVPAAEAIAGNAVIVAWAAELGHLRHAQSASLQQVLREYRALRQTLARFIKDEMRGLSLEPGVEEAIDLMDRLEAVIDALLRTTVDTLVAEYTETITQHAARLEGFNRMVTHELRQPLGVLQFGVKLLRSVDPVAARPRRDQILETLQRNVTRIDDTLKSLLALSRSSDSENNQVQLVDLGAMARDVATQFKEAADVRGVRVEVAGDLPRITIDAGRLELILANLVSNAIKYSDPDKLERFVHVTTATTPRVDVCALAVQDNGIGISEGDLRSIFGRFYRGHPERDAELGTSGLGLGLSIVADCVDALKGDVHAESALGQGTTFFVELPLTSQN
ncbi:MAG TPA: HAMP domain-containing sensor histidine kinase [Vicinamibacterales bacterium]